MAETFEPAAIFALWDALSPREQNFLISELLQQFPGGFTREDLMQFLASTLQKETNGKKS